MNTVEKLELQLDEAKKRTNELEHAKKVCDEISRIVGISSTYPNTIEFPGLREAYTKEDKIREEYFAAIKEGVSSEVQGSGGDAIGNVGDS